MVKFLKFILWSGLAGCGGALLIAASAYLYLSPSLPSVETLRDVHLQTPLRVFTRDEKLLAEFGEKRRTPVRIEETPEFLIQAFMAAEDDRFYSHPGVDIVGLMRAAVQLVSTGRIQSGGSTITMQVAKNFFLSHERVFSRKFNEILLALQIERELDKSEILELYLNKIYLGQRAYGVEAAAQVYYGKSIDELNLAQLAMIAGLPKAPSRYNPVNDPERALIRRDWILGRMLELGYINDYNYQTSVAEPVTARYHGARIELQAPYVAEMVRQEMVELYGPETYTEGYQVYTTVDSSLQEAANQAVVNGLFAYTERHGYRGPVTNLNEADRNLEINNSEIQSNVDVWKEALKNARASRILMPAVVTAVEDKTAHILLRNDEIDVIEWDNLNWAKHFINVNAFGYDPKSASDVLKAGDLILVRQMPDGRYRLSQAPEAQSSLVSMNPKDGAILSLVGGFNFFDSMYNRSTQAVRQAGSSFKPFVYAAAINEGLTAATMINDAPMVFADEGLEGTWRPNNDNMKFNGPMRLREGLYRSRNLVSIRLLREIGINRTINFLEGLGFEDGTMERNLGLALGNVSMTPLQLTTGYATVANGGYKVSPYLIERVETMDEVLFRASPATACPKCEDLQGDTDLQADAQTEPSEIDSGSAIVLAQGDHDDNVVDLTGELDTQRITPAEQVMDPRVNYIINDIMNDVIWKGTGRRAQVLKRRDIAGKTGTTNDSKDAWFVGFNPEVLTSVWVGMDDYTTLGRWEYGANAALPVWIDFMKVALDGKPEQRLPQPEGMVSLRIDPKTGRLARQGDNDAIFEIFRQEKAPTTVSEGAMPSFDDFGQSFKPEDLF
ncbi:penicillin-binding protein 1A [Endozoicomonas montiporae]|nr:penicillin-binding protein 1A [Endozoicomonas montiporae]AMO57879.1 membrane carboxypeptidase/penicillin-binding protein [Endozoicomonas montiporae CL-33]